MKCGGHHLARPCRIVRDMAFRKVQVASISVSYYACCLQRRFDKCTEFLGSKSKSLGILELTVVNGIDYAGDSDISHHLACRGGCQICASSIRNDLGIGVLNVA